MGGNEESWEMKGEVEFKTYECRQAGVSIPIIVTTPEDRLLVDRWEASKTYFLDLNNLKFEHRPAPRVAVWKKWLRRIERAISVLTHGDDYVD